MGKDSPTSVLIVKTSSLGDIVQAFDVLGDLRRRFPTVAIDWAVETSFHPIVAAHPLIRRAIPLEIKKRGQLWNSLRELRRERYDLIFDLQGNCKSGAITFLARGKVKVGYDWQSVREWPNVLATQVRFFVSRRKNIRAFYLELLERYFKTERLAELEGIRFRIELEEERKVSQILAKVAAPCKIMVCPGSKWINKQLEPETWIGFLQKIEQVFQASFLLIWGDEGERVLCKGFATHLKNAFVVDRVPIPTWQNLMNEVDLVIAVDSSALHLSGTTATPSFSIFGPTSNEVFKPIGQRHVAVQGTCPYGRVFEKQCPILRSCPTGACIKNLTVEELFQAFQNQCAFLRL